MRLRRSFAALLVALGVFIVGQTFAQGIPAGVSTDCSNTATAKFKTCVEACRGRSDAFNCCGDCDSEFDVTFQNCCNDHCKVDNPPASCSDDSGPGCAGGVVNHPEHPAWCSEETGMAPSRYKTALVGFVEIRDARRGETASGRFVANFDEFSNVPGLIVNRIRLEAPVDHHGHATLEGVVIDTGNGAKQPAYSVLTYSIPARGASIAFTISDERNPVHREKVSLPLAAESRPRHRQPVSKGAGQFSIVPVASLAGIGLVYGPLDGDSASTRITVNDKPGIVIAESPRELFFQSKHLRTGKNLVVLGKGSRSAVFDLFMPKLEIDADKTTLEKGESTRFRVRLSGLEQMPPAAWKPGAPAELFDVGGIPAPAKGGGRVVLKVTNYSPEVVSIVGSTGDTVTIAIGRDRLAGKPYQYMGTITARKAGSYKLDATIVPLLSELAALQSAFAMAPPKGIPCAHCETAKEGLAMDGPYDDEETCNEKAKVFGTGLAALGEAIEYCKDNFVCSDPECPKMTVRPPRPPAKAECGCEKVFGEWFYVCDYRNKLRCCCLQLF